MQIPKVIENRITLLPNHSFCVGDVCPIQSADFFKKAASFLSTCQKLQIEQANFEAELIYQSQTLEKDWLDILTHAWRRFSGLLPLFPDFEQKTFRVIAPEPVKFTLFDAELWTAFSQLPSDTLRAYFSSVGVLPYITVHRESLFRDSNLHEKMLRVFSKCKKIKQLRLIKSPYFSSDIIITVCAPIRELLNQPILTQLMDAQIFPGARKTSLHSGTLTEDHMVAKIRQDWRPF